MGDLVLIILMAAGSEGSSASFFCSFEQRRFWFACLDLNEIDSSWNKTTKLVVFFCANRARPE